MLSYSWSLTTEENFWGMLKCVPPAIQTATAFAVGEPYDHTADGPIHRVCCTFRDGYFTRLAPLKKFDPGTYANEIAQQFFGEGMITFLAPATMESLTEQLQSSGLMRVNVHVEFLSPVSCVVNRRRRKSLLSIDGKFFISSNKQLCFSPPAMKWNGFDAERALDITKITRIQKIAEPDETKLLEKSKRQMESLLKQAHSNFDVEWLRTTLPDPKRRPYRVVHPSKYFSAIVMEQVREAFETCKAYSHGRDALRGSGRDLSIRVEPSSNGTKVKAWYSSEYPGCGNGDYYVLLAPDLASFGERD